MELGANQKLWVEALKSGKYSQCTGLLFRLDEDGNKSYCCLGVATELFPSLLPRNIENLYGSEYNSILGLRGWNGDFEIDNVNECLATMNDSGKTFQEIAQFIENNADIVFSHSV